MVRHLIHKIKSKLKRKVDILEPAPLSSVRKPFYDEVRRAFGSLTQGQVVGFEKILDKWTESGLVNLHFLAYMLATAWHETGSTMQPIREFGLGKGKAYGKVDKQTGFAYYGRGFVQLTWKYNYEKYGIAHDPDRALDPDMAAHIMIDGMTKGVFTGVALGDFFTAKTNDPYNARKIINGLDKASTIAGYYGKFAKAISAIREPVALRVS